MKKETISGCGLLEIIPPISVFIHYSKIVSPTYITFVWFDFHYFNLFFYYLKYILRMSLTKKNKKRMSSMK